MITDWLAWRWQPPRFAQGLFDRRTAFTIIERKSGDVDECPNLWMIAGLGDDGPSITVAHQNHRPVHGVYGRLGVLLALGVGSLGGLRYGHRVAVLLEYLRYSFPAGAIGKCTVHQDHVLNAARRRRGGVHSRT